MSGAARKARKRSGEKYTKAQKTPTVRYTEQGKAVRNVPAALTAAQWSAIMGGADKIRARMDAEIRALQFPN